MNNEKGTKLTTVKLTAEQIALLLQILDEQLSTGNVEASERPLAFGVLAILEEAEISAYKSFQKTNAYTHYYS